MLTWQSMYNNSLDSLRNVIKLSTWVCLRCCLVKNWRKLCKRSCLHQNFKTRVPDLGKWLVVQFLSPFSRQIGRQKTMSVMHRIIINAWITWCHIWPHILAPCQVSKRWDFMHTFSGATSANRSTYHVFVQLAPLLAKYMLFYDLNSLRKYH